MGIDTVRIVSPFIDEGTAHAIERFSTLKQGIHQATGEMIYCFTTGELEGSWDSKIRFVVKRVHDVVMASGRPESQPCEPYLELECSWSKLINGQNVYGSLEHFQDTAETVIEIIEQLATAVSRYHFGDDQPEIELPRAAHWQVRRIDWAEMFYIQKDGVLDFFRQFKDVTFSRRSVVKYEDALFIPGSSTTVRLYYKGTEFKNHDASRLRATFGNYWGFLASDLHWHKTNTLYNYTPPKILPPTGVTMDNAHAHAIDTVNALQRLANNRLRAEVQINPHKFRYDFHEQLKDKYRAYPLVSEITDKYLKSVYTKEITKLLKEGDQAMKTVRNNDEVFARLCHVYETPRTARSLYAFWLTLSGMGEAKTKCAMSQSQYYANVKRLKDAGVSWYQTNIYILSPNSKLPVDFRPLIGDPRQCNHSMRYSSKLNINPVDYYQRLNTNRTNQHVH